jgi:hypothetical protein
MLVEMQDTLVAVATADPVKTPAFRARLVLLQPLAVPVEHLVQGGKVAAVAQAGLQTESMAAKVLLDTMIIQPHMAE